MSLADPRIFAVNGNRQAERQGTADKRLAVVERRGGGGGGGSGGASTFTNEVTGTAVGASAVLTINPAAAPQVARVGVGVAAHATNPLSVTSAAGSSLSVTDAGRVDLPTATSVSNALLVGADARLWRSAAAAFTVGGITGPGLFGVRITPEHVIHTHNNTLLPSASVKQTSMFHDAYYTATVEPSGVNPAIAYLTLHADAAVSGGVDRSGANWCSNLYLDTRIGVTTPVTNTVNSMVNWVKVKNVVKDNSTGGSGGSGVAPEVSMFAGGVEDSTTSGSPHARPWLVDWSLHTAISPLPGAGGDANRPEVLVGASLFGNNYYNFDNFTDPAKRRPVYSHSVMLALESYPGSGGFSGTWHPTAATFPFDYGLHFSGFAGEVTTLSSAIDGVVTTVPVVGASTNGFPTSGTILINGEQISYTGTTTTSFTGCTRGANGTTATAHITASSVVTFSRQNYKTAIGVGGGDPIWFEGASGITRVGTGIDVRGFETAGIVIGNRFAGSSGYALTLGIDTAGVASVAQVDGILFGTAGATNLYRSATAELRTVASFAAGYATRSGGSLYTGVYAGNDGGIECVAIGTVNALSVYSAITAPNNSLPRFTISRAGRLDWAANNAAVDVGLMRTAALTLSVLGVTGARGNLAVDEGRIMATRNLTAADPAAWAGLTIDSVTNVDGIVMASPYDVVGGSVGAIAYVGSTTAPNASVIPLAAKVFVDRMGSAQNEAAYFQGVSKDRSLTAANHPRIWGQDLAVHGCAFNQQNTLINNIVAVTNTHYNGSPTDADSAVLVLNTGRSLGPDAHTGVDTYAVDCALAIVGRSEVSTTLGVGFTTAIRIGGGRAGWYTSSYSAPVSRIGTGITIEDFATGGIKIHKRTAGSTGAALTLGLDTAGVSSTTAEDGITFGATAPVSVYRSGTSALAIDISNTAGGLVNVLTPTTLTAAQSGLLVSSGQTIAINAGGAVRAFSVAGTYTLTGEPNAVAFIGFSFNPTITLSSSGTPTANDMNENRGFSTGGSVNLVASTTYGNISAAGEPWSEFRAATSFLAGASATATVPGGYTAFNAAAHVVNAGYTLTTHRGLWAQCPVGASGATITTMVGVDIEDLNAWVTTSSGTLTNPALSLRSVGASVEMRHAGAGVFGANAAPANAQVGLEVQSTTKALLVSRLTNAQIATLATAGAIDGMIVYCTDAGALAVGMFQRIAGAWQAM